MSQRTHTGLIDSVLNDVLRIVAKCRRPSPTDHMPILSDIQPAELHRLEARLCLAKRVTLGADHILQGQLAGSSDVPQERLKSRRPFAPAAPKILNGLSKLGNRAAQWINYNWSAKYSVLHFIINRISSRPLGMGLPRTPRVKLNRLRIGVGRFHYSMYK